MKRPELWPPGRRLLLMRHGETYEPRLDTAMADRDANPALPLTPRGRDELRAVAEWLAPCALDAAWASPFHRAQETARIVAAPRGLDVGTLDALCELPLHPPGGGTLLDVARQYLALARALEATSPHDVPLEDGRSLGAIVDDALVALHGALERATSSVLVVAHGGLNRFLLAHWLGMPPARAIAIEQSFACVNVVDFVGRGRPWVRAVNLTRRDPLKCESPGI